MFKIQDLEKALKPTLNGKFKPAVITGREKSKLNWAFNQSFIPLLYSEKALKKVPDETSLYHKRPKGVYRSASLELARVNKLRNSVKMAEKRGLELRQEKLNKKKERGVWEIIDKTKIHVVKDTLTVKVAASSKGKGGAKKRTVPGHLKEIQQDKRAKTFNRNDQEELKGLKHVLGEEIDIEDKI